MKHIYLAAPLFTKGEQDFNLSVSEYLQSNGHRVFLPQQECKNTKGEDIYKTCLAGLRYDRPQLLSQLLMVRMLIVVLVGNVGML